MRNLLHICYMFCLCTCIIIAQSFPQEAEAAQKNAATAAHSPEKIQQDLDTYALWYINTMIQEMKPGIKSKKIDKHPEGFIASYWTIDPASLKTSFSVSENKAVAYIGRVIYHRVEYICISSSEKNALAGPFIESNRQPTTDIIMHLKGKWTYRY